MEDKQASYYMNIPATVWNADVKPNVKLCYGHISVLANKLGYCYATNRYLGKQLGVVKETASKYVSILEELGVIKTVVIVGDNKQVEERRIYITDGLIGINQTINTPNNNSINSPINQNVKGNTTRNNNTSINTNSKWDTIYDKLIDGYPKNRIQSKNPVIKLLKKLDKEEIKLVLANKQRYLNAVGDYVKNLRKYIEEECWSEEWLNLQESTNKTRNGGITDTKTFDNNYDDID